MTLILAPFDYDALDPEAAKAAIAAAHRIHLQQGNLTRSILAIGADLIQVKEARYQAQQAAKDQQRRDQRKNSARRRKREEEHRAEREAERQRQRDRAEKTALALIDEFGADAVRRILDAAADWDVADALRKAMAP